MSGEVRVDRDADVLVITIDRPAARNALDAATSAGIAEAVDLLDADSSSRVGILTGSGGTFCAGADLKALLAGESPDLPGRGLGGITRTPPNKPLIAAVEGHALAGGMELVLACDLVVASASATFGLPEVRRGLVAAAGGVLALPQRIPRNVAMGMILTGDPITAQQAYEVGLVNTVTDTGAALDRALDLARRIARNAPLAVAASKRVVAAVPTWPGEECWVRQAEIVDPVFASADAREGARAFADKREPVWRGS